MSTAHRFPIGTKYLRPHGKVFILCAVVDHLTTRNSKGEIVRASYVTAHEFCGQQITETDVCDTAIARGLLPEGPHLLQKSA